MRGRRGAPGGGAARGRGRRSVEQGAGFLGGPHRSRPISCSLRAGLRGAGPQTLITAIGCCVVFSTADEAPEENSSYSRAQSAYPVLRISANSFSSRSRSVTVCVV